MKKLFFIINVLGVEVSKGVLLYGPSGCGKTILAKAICNQIKTNWVELKASEIYSKFFILN